MLPARKIDFAAHNIQANLFSWPVTIDVKTEHGDSPLVAIDLHGKFPTSALQSMINLPLIKQINGMAPYHAQLQLYPAKGRKNDCLKITSNLQGISIDLPRPFTKKSTEARDFNVLFAFGDRGNQKLTLQYDRFFHGSINLKTEELSLDIDQLEWANWQP